MEEQRTQEQLREHYEIERELASRLRSASKLDRQTLYSSLYDEMYRRVPNHPQFSRKSSVEERRDTTQSLLYLLDGLLTKSTSFLEVGPGDCALSFAAADLVKDVCAVDVSEIITSNAAVPDNFRLILSNGCSVPVPDGSIDVVFSNQLMEHLHIEDAREQLENILRALAPGGSYLCITPNRLSGPHDVSGHFDDVATGFHLKEYTVTELNKLFKAVGYTRIRIVISARGRSIRVPVLPTILLEAALSLLPIHLRRKLARTRVIALLISVNMIGVKKA